MFSMHQPLPACLMLPFFQAKQFPTNHQAKPYVWAVPGSKSLSNRLLLLASLALYQNTNQLANLNIHGLLESDDVNHMLNCLQKLSNKLSIDLNCGLDSSGHSNNKQLQLTRNFNPTIEGDDENTIIDLFVGNAGTVMRSLTAMLACLGGNYRLTGIERMHERPIGDLLNVCSQFGAEIECLQQDGYPPLWIKSSKDLYLPAQLNILAGTSSQFVSALLMALPILEQKVKSKQALPDYVDICLQGDVISQPYIEMTLACMHQFGVHVEFLKNTSVPTYRYYTKQQYVLTELAQQNYQLQVEPDASSASYPLAIGVLAGDILVPYLNKTSLQGDVAFVDALIQMGADVTFTDAGILAKKSILHGAVIDCKAIPDAAMTLAVLALKATGTTTLKHIKSWKVKETDRILAMVNELTKVGAMVEYSDDHISITPPNTLKPSSIETYDDHRMAMCFSLLGFMAEGASILDPKCVQKTYPTYWQDFFNYVLF